jgi:hypothetical protein
MQNSEYYRAMSESDLESGNAESAALAFNASYATESFERSVRHTMSRLESIIADVKRVQGHASGDASGTPISVAAEIMHCVMAGMMNLNLDDMVRYAARAEMAQRAHIER